MKRKRLFLAMAALLAAGGFWLAWEAWRASAARSSMAGGLETSQRQPNLDQSRNVRPRLAPPDPMRRFRELTPEQRVKLARQGPIGG